MAAKLALHGGQVQTLCPVMSDNTEQFEFKAETQRVLSLVINSLYTNNEVFLRELVSNASDALDKARFLQTSERDAINEQEGDPTIDITVDSDNNTLTIEDNGVGMTREEAIDNLGTIARSGTGDFVEKMAEFAKKAKKEDALELIGQFGVGFYSVFMVASRVDVETLSMRKDSKPVLWRSTGEGKFTVLEGERTTPGTSITVHLNEDAEEFAKKWRVEAIIKKYSDFVMFPIRVDGEVANKSSALWRMPRSQVDEEQHAEFFKHITQGRHGDKPQVTIHYSVDAPVQFSALLYIPEAAALDIFMFQKERPGLRLYAKRVLIMESCEKLLPAYLRFVRGVVDSEDLDLNVSRETLQENRTIRTIESQLTKQILKELGKISDNEEERYQTFWKQFGMVLKEGLSIDVKNKDAITDLCRFESMKSGGELISLKEYIEQKPEGQEAIYFITGTEKAQVENSPHLEVFRKKGFDVLMMTDPIDEWVVQSIGTYSDCKLESVVHGKLEIDEEHDRDEEDQSQLEAGAKAVALALGDKVADVRLSTRLTDTAACLVSKEGTPGANMERIMKVLDDRAEQRTRILEINPDHAIVKNLATLVARDPQSSHIQLWAELLHDQALLSEGLVEDPARLVRRLQELLTESSNTVLKG
jgi:molecular chaperone HtpG